MTTKVVPATVMVVQAPGAGVTTISLRLKVNP